MNWLIFPVAIEVKNTMTASLLKLLALVCLSRKVSGHYCEYDLCDSEQYCCGDNICCDYVYSLWYFWVGVVFLVLLVSACGGLFRYYYRRWSQEGGGPPYTSLPSSPPRTLLPQHMSSHDPLFQVREDSGKHNLWKFRTAHVMCKTWIIKLLIEEKLFSLMWA